MEEPTNKTKAGARTRTRKRSLTARVQEILIANWRERVKAGTMRPSEAAMSACDLSQARAIVRIGRKRGLSDERILFLARD